MKINNILSLFLIVLFIACEQNDNKTNTIIPPKIEITELAEKDMAYLDIDESMLKSTNPEEDKRKMQIVYSAYKRAHKYIKFDTTNNKLICKIKSGDEINISPLLYEYIKAVVYFGNKNQENAIKKHPEIKEELYKASKRAFNESDNENIKITNEYLPEWSSFVEGIKKYREERNNP